MTAQQFIAAYLATVAPVAAIIDGAVYAALAIIIVKRMWRSRHGG